MKVFIIAALSVDGFIAQDSAQVSTAWTSAGDKRRFVALTKAARAMVLGRPTFETFGGRPLKGRDIFVLSRQGPSGLHTSQGEVPGLGGAAPDDRALLDPERPAAVVRANLDPKALVERLAALGYAELAVCGGAQVYGQFMAVGLVQELRLSIEPRLFGRGVALFDRALAGGEGGRLSLIGHELGPEGTIFADYRVEQ